MVKAFYTLFAVRCFFVGSPLFCCCSQIVYSELINFRTRYLILLAGLCTEIILKPGTL